MKPAYIDIGELDFSIRLSAYIKWLKNQGRPASLVMTYPDRRCLYERWVEKVVNVPDEFYKDFDREYQWGSHIGNGECLEEETQQQLMDYFNKKLPEGYCVAKEMGFTRGFVMVHCLPKLFVPYPYEEKFTGKKEILVFPRARQISIFSNRNIPKIFYVKLIERLCDTFKDYTIRTMGLKFAAYNITEVKKDNYINSVEEASSLQRVIDRCRVAAGAIGSHSTLLLFTMLQGVPSFIIGKNQVKAERDNWLKTKYCFFSTIMWIFKNWKDEKEHEKAITKAISFFKEVDGYDRNSRQPSIVYKGE